TWHLYFGDRVGTPGTLLTFFPHPLARERRAGTGEVAQTTFAVPPGTLDAWRYRLAQADIAAVETELAGQHALAFADPHTTRLVLVESTGPAGAVAWADGGVPADTAIRG